MSYILNVKINATSGYFSSTAPDLPSFLPSFLPSLDSAIKEPTGIQKLFYNYYFFK